MITPPYNQDEVIGEADRLMKRLLKQANDGGAEVDFAVQIMQTATKWVAVRNRMTPPDEGNAFDGWRGVLGGGGDGAGNSAVSAVKGADSLRASDPGKEPQASHRAVSTRTSRASRATATNGIRRGRTPLA